LAGAMKNQVAGRNYSIFAALMTSADVAALPRGCWPFPAHYRITANRITLPAAPPPAAATATPCDSEL